ncbi:conjugal transfer protein TraW [Neisseria sp. Ec49-e6-T10]|uniref:conjugal transfer protein TraW n=1 Tax=Neisseria sp. Ec49-e6-T10 TaxID=3140744 RepID=UPI003EC02ACB
MNIKYFMCSTLLLSVVSFAHLPSVEKIGTTYAIAEQDAIESIKQKMERMQKSGELAKMQNEAAKRINQSARQLPKVEGLHQVQKSTVRYVELSYTLPENVYDQEGNIIALAGATVKPLEVTNIRHQMFFFNGNDKEQVKLAKKLANEIGFNFMPILVEGRWDQLAQELGQAVYFDQQGKMSQSFQLTEVPVLVSQDEKRLKLETFKVGE